MSTRNLEPGRGPASIPIVLDDANSRGLVLAQTAGAGPVGGAVTYRRYDDPPRAAAPVDC